MKKVSKIHESLTEIGKLVAARRHSDYGAELANEAAREIFHDFDATPLAAVARAKLLGQERRFIEAAVELRKAADLCEEVDAWLKDQGI